MDFVWFCSLFYLEQFLIHNRHSVIVVEWMTKRMNKWTKYKSEPAGILEVTNVSAANGEDEDQRIN